MYSVERSIPSWRFCVELAQAKAAREGLAIKCPAPVLCPSDDRSAPNGEGRLFGLTLTLPRCKGVYPDEGNNYEHKSQCNELFHPGYFPFAFGPGGKRDNLILSLRARLRTACSLRLSGFVIAAALSPAAANERSRPSSSGVHRDPTLFTGSLISSPSARSRPGGSL